ncbi:unnamed protein product [Amoebophrya sp. A25]|nr:unnamed protein product [Amoebophrya sp. A25]|eukprot:GSA25T00017423001.1
MMKAPAAKTAAKKTKPLSEHDAVNLSKRLGIIHSDIYFPDYQKFWNNGNQRGDTAAVEAIFGNGELNQIYQSKITEPSLDLRYTNIFLNADDWTKKLGGLRRPEYGQKTKYVEMKLAEYEWQQLLIQADSRYGSITTGTCINTCKTALIALFNATVSDGSAGQHQLAFFGKLACMLFGTDLLIKKLDVAWKESPTVPEKEPWRVLKKALAQEREGLVLLSQALQDWHSWFSVIQDRRDAYLFYKKLRGQSVLLELSTDAARTQQLKVSKSDWKKETQRLQSLKELDPTICIPAPKFQSRSRKEKVEENSKRSRNQAEQASPSLDAPPRKIPDMRGSPIAIDGETNAEVEVGADMEESWVYDEHTYGHGAEADEMSWYDEPIMQTPRIHPPRNHDAFFDFGVDPASVFSAVATSSGPSSSGTSSSCTSSSGTSSFSSSSIGTWSSSSSGASSSRASSVYEMPSENAYIINKQIMNKKGGGKNINSKNSLHFFSYEDSEGKNQKGAASSFFGGKNMGDSMNMKGKAALSLPLPNCNAAGGGGSNNMDIPFSSLLPSQTKGGFFDGSFGFGAAANYSFSGKSGGFFGNKGGAFGKGALNKAMGMPASMVRAMSNSPVRALSPMNVNRIGTPNIGTPASVLIPPDHAIRSANTYSDCASTPKPPAYPPQNLEPENPGGDPDSGGVAEQQEDEKKSILKLRLPQFHVGHAPAPGDPDAGSGASEVDAADGNNKSPTKLGDRLKRLASTLQQTTDPNSFAARQKQHATHHYILMQLLVKVEAITIDDEEAFDAAIALVEAVQQGRLLDGWLVARINGNERILYYAIELLDCSVALLLADRVKLAEQFMAAADHGREFENAATEHERPWLEHMNDILTQMTTAGLLQSFFDQTGTLDAAQAVTAVAESVQEIISEGATELGLTSGIPLHYYSAEKARSALPKGVVTDPVRSYTAALRSFSRGLIPVLFRPQKNRRMDKKVRKLMLSAANTIHNSVANMSRLCHDAKDEVRFLGLVSQAMDNVTQFVVHVSNMSTQTLKENTVERASTSLLIMPLSRFRQYWNNHEDLHKKRDFSNLHKIVEMIYSRFYTVFVEPVLRDKVFVHARGNITTARGAESYLMTLYLFQFVQMRQGALEDLKNEIYEHYTGGVGNRLTSPLRENGPGQNADATAGLAVAPESPSSGASQ